MQIIFAWWVAQEILSFVLRRMRTSNETAKKTFERPTAQRSGSKSPFLAEALKIRGNWLGCLDRELPESRGRSPRATCRSHPGPTNARCYKQSITQILCARARCVKDHHWSLRVGTVFGGMDGFGERTKLVRPFLEGFCSSRLDYRYIP